MRPDTEEVVRKYADSLSRLAYSICRNEADAKDAVQECFISYHTSKAEFTNEGHLKAWLIRVTINKSKDIVSSFWHRNRTDWQEYMAETSFDEPGDSELFETVMKLPEKYRIVIHLFYYEDYSVSEISDIMNLRENTVKSRLLRGRKILKERLTEVCDND